MNNNPVIIVGAGLSGLRAASLLAAEGINCKVFECRDRIGGRVLSSYDVNNPDLGKFDLGPTWFWPEVDSTVTKLVKKLNLETFSQYSKGAIILERTPNSPPERYVLPENSVPKSMRFKGGVESLINALAQTIPPGILELNSRVTSIQLNKSDVITVLAELADGRRKKLTASAVILALPPRIVARSIEFSPSLPLNISNELINKPTWMAGQAKIIMIYDSPFWRDAGLSGFVSSWVGPLQEIHDASPETGSGALFGFFRIPAKVRRELGKEKISKLVIAQLVKLFGSSAQNVSSILYKDWSIDSETAIEEDSEPIGNHPVYGPTIITGEWEKKIIFAGTEASSEFGGHLEGALRSAEQAVLEISNLK